MGGVPFATTVHVNGVRLDLRGRKRCLACRPHRPLRGPRKPVQRPIELKICAQCGERFPAKAFVAGVLRSLYRRRFCLSCSPFGVHNTSRLPAAALSAGDLVEYRRKRRNDQTYRYQKKKRRELKAELIASRGGRCADCGYNAAVAALEFHHRDAGTKEFQISKSSVSRSLLWAEAAKCDLLCANCHRMRHIATPAQGEPPTVTLRRERKTKRCWRWVGRARAAVARFMPGSSSSITSTPARRTSPYPPTEFYVRGRRSRLSSRSASCSARTATARPTPGSGSS